jgi:hypothetical protein
MSGDVIPLKAGGRVTAIVPQTIEEVFRLSKAVAASGIGLPPMQAIQRIAVVNGRPAVWGDAIPALLLARGFRIREWVEGSDDSRCAVCEIKRPDGEKIERRFSIGDAKRAGLWQTAAKVRRKAKDGTWYEKDNDSPWFRFPERMLQMRARGFAARDGAADALSGLYLREEIDEAQTVEAAPQIKAAVLELPDIPDEPPADANAVLREIERALQHMTPEGVHHQFSTAIMAMDEDSRAAALEMIEAAKAE